MNILAFKSVYCFLSFIISSSLAGIFDLLLIITEQLQFILWEKTFLIYKQWQTLKPFSKHSIATEQLEKSREIIKRLKAEKQEAVAELEGKLRDREDVMEKEKETLVQEVSRGKSAAITLMQVWWKSVLLCRNSVIETGVKLCD